jgi:hypothetical protein
VLAATTWPDVGLALVIALPGLFAAYYAARAADHARKANAALETPSKTRIGQQVEDALQTAIANNYRIQAMTGGVDAAMPEKAAAVEADVLARNEIKTRAQRADRG